MPIASITLGLFALMAEQVLPVVCLVMLLRVMAAEVAADAWL